MKSLFISILFIGIMTSCSSGKSVSKASDSPYLASLQRAQNYDEYIEIKSVLEFVEVTNMSLQKDTLILYVAHTQFSADNSKIKRYVRMCFLSNPYQFYQAPIKAGDSGFAIGKIDAGLKSIELMQNGTLFKTLSEIHYTMIE